MILIDAGKRDAKSLDAKILFAAQLSARGHRVSIDDNTVPEDMAHDQKYEIAPYLTDVSDISVSRIFLIGAEDVCDETLMNLRSYDLDPKVQVAAIGRFPTQQALIGSRAKIAYALGREPHVVDLNDFQKKQLLSTSVLPLTATAPRDPKPARSTPEVFMFLPPKRLEEPMTLPMLGAMNHLGEFRLNVVISGKGKAEIKKSKYSSLVVYGVAELSTTTLAKLADIAVFYGEGVPGERMATFALDLMRNSGVVIDCTDLATFAMSGAPVLRGPEDIGALPNYLESTVLINRKEISRQIKANPWMESNSLERLETALNLPAVDKPVRASKSPQRTLFYPTNGNGLGHAQRCSLIASQFKDASACAFAAFPSCIPLINSKGLISNSGKSC